MNMDDENINIHKPSPTKPSPANSRTVWDRRGRLRRPGSFGSSQSKFGVRDLSGSFGSFTEFSQGGFSNLCASPVQF